jgi:hypothetical protein
VYYLQTAVNIYTKIFKLNRMFNYFFSIHIFCRFIIVFAVEEEENKDSYRSASMKFMINKLLQWGQYIHLIITYPHILASFAFIAYVFTDR